METGLAEDNPFLYCSQNIFNVSLWTAFCISYTFSFSHMEDIINCKYFLGSVFGFDGTFPSSVSNAKVIMLHNMAALYCLKKENDKAKDALLQVRQVNNYRLCLCADCRISNEPGRVHI